MPLANAREVERTHWIDRPLETRIPVRVCCRSDDCCVFVQEQQEIIDEVPLFVQPCSEPTGGLKPRQTGGLVAAEHRLMTLA